MRVSTLVDHVHAGVNWKSQINIDAILEELLFFHANPSEALHMNLATKTT